MTTRILLSILIPTYNRGDQLRKLINHIDEIDFPSCEVLISNDGSTDDTKNILESLADQYELQVYNQSKNLGIPENLNFLYQRSSGEYIVYLHDHDLVHKRYFEYIINALDASGSQAGYSPVAPILDFHSNHVVADYKIIKGQRIRKDFMDSISFSCKINASAIFRRSLLKDLKRDVPFESDYGFFADIEFWMACGTMTSFVESNEPLLFVSDREDDHDFRPLNWKYFFLLSKIYRDSFISKASDTDLFDQVTAEWSFMKKTHWVVIKQGLIALKNGDSSFVNGLLQNCDDLFLRSRRFIVLKYFLLFLKTICK